MALTTQTSEDIQRLQLAISNIGRDIESITTNRLKEMTLGGKFQTLDATVKDLSKDLVKVKTQRDLKGKEEKEEEHNRASLIKSQKEVRFIMYASKVQTANLMLLLVQVTPFVVLTHQCRLFFPCCIDREEQAGEVDRVREAESHLQRPQARV